MNPTIEGVIGPGFLIRFLHYDDRTSHPVNFTHSQQLDVGTSSERLLFPVFYSLHRGSALEAAVRQKWELLKTRSFIGILLGISCRPEIRSLHFKY